MVPTVHFSTKCSRRIRVSSSAGIMPHPGRRRLRNRWRSRGATEDPQHEQVGAGGEGEMVEAGMTLRTSLTQAGMARSSEDVDGDCIIGLP